jgi:Helix-turn-helix domain
MPLEGRDATELANDDSHPRNPMTEYYDDDLLTTVEVADLLRVPPATVRYWRHIGRGPEGFKVGQHVVYRYQRVREWITAQEAA